MDACICDTDMVFSLIYQVGFEGFRRVRVGSRRGGGGRGGERVRVLPG